MFTTSLQDPTSINMFALFQKVIFNHYSRYFIIFIEFGKKYNCLVNADVKHLPLILNLVSNFPSYANHIILFLILTRTTSTSKISVAPGGTLGLIPSAPYAREGGTISSRLDPFFIPGRPSSQPCKESRWSH